MRAENKGNTETLFIVTLYSVLTLLSLLMVLIGANVYKNSVNSAEDNSSVRTVLLYASTKLRACGPANARVQEYNGGDMLVISETYNDIEYNTYLYSNDGSFMELFTLASEEFRPENGEKITGISAFNVRYSENCFVFTAEADGVRRSLTVADGQKLPRGGAAA